MAPIKIDDVHKEIQSLVSQYSPLDISNLAYLYRKHYGQDLDIKSFGSLKLKDFAIQIPLVKLVKKKNRLLLEPKVGPEPCPSPPSTTLEVHIWVQKVVSQHAPLDLNRLNSIHRTQFGQVLDFRRLGYSKMKIFVMAVPKICVYSRDSKLLLEPIQEFANPSYSEPSTTGALDQDTARVCITSNQPEKAREVTPPTQGNASPSLPRVNLKQVVDHKNSIDASESRVSFSVISEEEIAVEGHLINVPEQVRSYFEPAPVDVSLTHTFGVPLGDGHFAKTFQECALLGRLQPDEDHLECCNPQAPVYLNTHEPFCLAAVGVQGAGKSHTLACILESCLLRFPLEGVSRLKKPNDIIGPALRPKHDLCMRSSRSPITSRFTQR
jgi:hypothetical protein